MPVSLAYLAIILIWSTTPLAIRWSTEGAGFAFSALARMLIGALVAAAILGVGRIRLPLHARARRAYVVGGLGLFGIMALTYWGARYVSSGLISVMFGLSPLMAGLLAACWLGERSLTPTRLAGTLLGASGLALIFMPNGATSGTNVTAGLVALLVAVFISSASLVVLKRIGDDSPPLATTFGSLAVSLPLFGLLWLADGAALPVALPSRTVAAIGYLGIFGSVIGFALYYYVIKHLEASKVALITLITPVMALLLGHLLNREEIGPQVMAGTGLILLGLVVHESSTWRPVLGRLRGARG
ncbi:MAG: DMT family transporter [Rhodocyclaceae bacterium]|nr:MAG: DMT family transporter [Rhodocyclaceae bacterium]